MSENTSSRGSGVGSRESGVGSKKGSGSTLAISHQPVDIPEEE